MAKAATLKAQTADVRKAKLDKSKGKPRNCGASSTSPFRLTSELRQLRARLRKLYNDAYYSQEGMPSEGAPRKAWKAFYERRDAAREALEAEIAKEMGKHCVCIGGLYRPRKSTSPDQHLGEFRLDGDRAAAS
ncbi:MAG TPA: hypothetical protein VFB61_16125, partial [Gemmatimonadales bacterium]|nr:hypothetical protein [Gemmatimonadales bacterium]